MKKIFRMALVFALAGATLMYTGCSKDYTEDINNVKSNVGDLQNKLGELNNELSALKSSVSSLEAAYKAADDLIKGDVSDLKTRVGKVEEAIKDLSKYATKDELNEAVKGVEKKISDAKAEIKKTTDDLQKQINELKEKLAADEEAIKKLQEAQKEVDNVYGFLSDELRSLEFLPDFYFGGIEATSYDWSYLLGNEPFGIAKAKEMDVVVDTTGQTAKVVFPVKARAEQRRTVLRDEKDNVIKFKYDSDKEEYVLDEDGNLIVDKNGRELPYADDTMGQLGLATYDLNPSSFPVDSAEWSMKGREAEYVVKSSEAKYWAPIVNSVSKNEANQVEVDFTIEHPEYAFSTISEAIINAIWDEQFGATETNVCHVQLVATLSDNREVHSNWHAVTSGMELVHHLAFASNNKYVTENEEDCGAILGPDKKVMVKDLYKNAYDAVEPAASVKVKYNGGPVEFADKIAVHTYNYGTYTIDDYTLAEFNEKYPGFSFKFELVPYTIGDNKTSEDMYGQFDGTVFTPCYVESAGGKATRVPIEKDSEDGISAVGRMPIVLVYLVNDETGYSYAVGYFKILIAKDAREPETRTFEIPGLDKVPYICGPFTLSTKWHEFSYFVLENLKVDYEEFLKNYTFTGIYGYENIVNPADPSGKTFVTSLEKLADAAPGDTVELKYNDPKAQKELNYGKAVYAQDKSGTGINDAFTWTVAPQDIQQGNAKSIYFRFESGAYDIVYFEMKADVANAATFDFGANKIANEWHDDINNEAKNTTRINVLVPNKTSDDVTDFYRDLNRFFIGYHPSMTLTAESDPVYANYFDPKADKKKYNPAELEGDFTFYFSDEQPAINGVQLYTNYWANSDTLYVAQYVKKNGKDVMVTDTVQVDGKDVVVPAIIDTNTIAFFQADTTVLQYYYKDGEAMSKTLLNLWSYTQTDQAKMLYANILVDVTYGECEIPAGGAAFHVRFVRPLDVNFKSADIAEESAVAGFNVLIAQFVKDITDWNKQSVIVPEKDKSGKATGYYVANIIKDVNMYEYYKFSKLILDLEHAKRDHFKIGDDDAQDLLSKVTPDAKLTLGTVNDKGVFTPGTSNELDITNLATLKTAAINYQNDRAVVETFNIYIPVAIEYAWGTINEVLVIKVKPTSDTTPHSL